MERALELLAGAERPLIVVGGGGWSEQAGRDVLAFAEASNVPIASMTYFDPLLGLWLVPGGKPLAGSASGL